jgi:hypothetical protein
MINDVKKESSLKKRKRFKIPLIRVHIKDNKIIYENNSPKYQDTHNTRQWEK